ncbi:shikimate dehydrogenase [Pelagibius sp. Alg239-R121]|uniref:shikimate dehydrogenase n=1 Tax=Pelagibius sp. Alg239-R121 TaxID=2993448 RepID=UPI0024A65248|nr:shikimate dehydrogenase [Pelagibius sp. Alg239-R121]
MSLTGKARLAGVIGWPVGHSRSPRLHGFWLERYAIDGAYLPLPVDPEDFEIAVKGLAAAGFRGVNVTVPHKEAALRICDKVDPFAAKVGAVNTLVFGDDGISGSNTDAFGFLENLRNSAAGYRPDAGPVLVVGAGGAGRGIVAALLNDGVADVRITNRTENRAEQVAEELSRRFDGKIEVVSWDRRVDALEDVTLLVNTTSQGMHGQPALDLKLDGLPAGALVNDIVYTPLETPLLAAARQRGNQTVDGLGMLLHQARPGFSAWFGINPEVTEDLRATMLEP